jgi:YidC/Oxa1 family membrane protein insertase
MFILFPLYGIIRRPFKYLFGLTEETTVAVAKAIGWSDFTVAGMNELSLAARLTESNLSAAQAAANSDKLFAIPFDFFGIDLSQIPSWKFWADGLSWAAIGLFLLPVISCVLSFVSSKVTQKTNAMNKEQEEQQQSAQMRSMMITMPLMSLWIGFSLPAGLCVYWIANSAFGMLQEVVCGKMLKKDYEEAQRKLAESAAAEKEAEKERRRLAAEKKAAALAEKKSKKKAEPKAEEDTPSINKADSRVGMRTYARGRAYDPNRYPTFPYRDPSKAAPAEENNENKE